MSNECIWVYLDKKRDQHFTLSQRLCWTANALVMYAIYQETLTENKRFIAALRIFEEVIICSNSQKMKVYVHI